MTKGVGAVTIAMPTSYTDPNLGTLQLVTITTDGYRGQHKYSYWESTDPDRAIQIIVECEKPAHVGPRMRACFHHVFNDTISLKPKIVNYALKAVPASLQRPNYRRFLDVGELTDHFRLRLIAMDNTLLIATFVETANIFSDAIYFDASLDATGKITGMSWDQY